MKRLLFWSATMILTFGLLVTATRVIVGSIRSGKPTVADKLAADSHLGPSGWCWHDICLGQTSMADADISLRVYAATGFIYSAEFDRNSATYKWKSTTDPQWSGEIVGNSIDFNDELTQFQFEFSGTSIYLGDLLQLFGTPQAVSLCEYQGYNGMIGTVIVSHLHFKNSIHVIVYKLNLPPSFRLSPDMVVDFIDMFPIDHDLPGPWEPSSWKGFTIYPKDCADN